MTEKFHSGTVVISWRVERHSVKTEDELDALISKFQEIAAEGALLRVIFRDHEYELEKYKGQVLRPVDVTYAMIHKEEMAKREAEEWPPAKGIKND